MADSDVFWATFVCLAAESPRGGVLYYLDNQLRLQQTGKWLPSSAWLTFDPHLSLSAEGAPRWATLRKKSTRLNNKDKWLLDLSVKRYTPQVHFMTGAYLRSCACQWGGSFDVRARWCLWFMLETTPALGPAFLALVALLRQVQRTKAIWTTSRRRRRKMTDSCSGRTSPAVFRYIKVGGLRVSYSVMTVRLNLFWSAGVLMKIVT